MKDNGCYWQFGWILRTLICRREQPALITSSTEVHLKCSCLSNCGTRGELGLGLHWRKREKHSNLQASNWREKLFSLFHAHNAKCSAPGWWSNGSSYVQCRFPSCFVLSFGKELMILLYRGCWRLNSKKVEMLLSVCQSSRKCEWESLFLAT